VGCSSLERTRNGEGPGTMFRGLLAGATLTGLEPATSAVTGRHSNQLSYRALHVSALLLLASTWTTLPDVLAALHHFRCEPSRTSVSPGRHGFSVATGASTPNGIRTRVAGVKGRCPGPLDDGGPGQRTARPKAYPPARIDASDVCVDAAYVTPRCAPMPPRRPQGGRRGTGRGGGAVRGRAVGPGCASQPQPGRPWFDGLMVRISRQ